jgi:ubiquinone/menaquinone biosynthesis C-methylase UbiE
MSGSEDSADPDERWSRYWADGELHSLSMAFPENYGGAVRDFWDAGFSNLPDGARVLDIATGNGAVALLAVEHARARSVEFEVHGVDRADIDPVRTARKKGGDLLDHVRFHGRTAVERLPFPDAHFDQVTGQYAFEYTELERSAAEIARVLRPAGRLDLILHHDESIVMSNGPIHLRYARWLFEELDFFNVAETLLRRMDAARTAEQRAALARDAEAETLRNRFNDICGQITREIRGSVNPHFLQVAINRARGCFEAVGKLPLKRILGELSEARRELELNRGRMTDLLACRCDGAGRDAIEHAVDAAGFRIQDSGLMREGGGSAPVLIGWWLRATVP